MSMVEALGGLDVGAANKKAITEWLAANSKDPPDVCCCKLQNIRDDGKHTIIAGMRHIAIRDSIISAVIQIGAVVKSDSPPPSNLEDEVAAWLSALG